MVLRGNSNNLSSLEYLNAFGPTAPPQKIPGNCSKNSRKLQHAWDGSQKKSSDLLSKMISRQLRIFPVVGKAST